jgi:Protein of unknown function (DUF3455)
MTPQSKDARDEASSAELTADAFTATELTDMSRGASITNQDLPPEIRVDEQANEEIARRIGRGYQVYDCLPPADPAATWKFREPLADLYDHHTGKQRGIHFAGPNWADGDGSRVTGGKITKHDSPDNPSKDVPWLRVEADQTFGFNGVFSNVTFIQRVLTDGGAAPTSCEADSGATLSVPYIALYIFWTERKR